jgi:hypothetical protein
MKTAINLTQAPNQSVSANISEPDGTTHIVDIKLRTMPTGYLIMDMGVDDTPLFYGRRCVNKMPLMLGHTVTGNFYFYDQYGNTDPVYTGLSDRYLLIYDDEYELG